MGFSSNLRSSPQLNQPNPRAPSEPPRFLTISPLNLTLTSDPSPTAVSIPHPRALQSTKKTSPIHTIVITQTAWQHPPARASSSPPCGHRARPRPGAPTRFPRSSQATAKLHTLATMGFLKSLGVKRKDKSAAAAASAAAANAERYAPSPSNPRYTLSGYAGRQVDWTVKLPVPVLTRIFSFVCPHAQDMSYESCERSAEEDACMLCDLRDLSYCVRVCRRWRKTAVSVL